MEGTPADETDSDDDIVDPKKSSDAEPVDPRSPAGRLQQLIDENGGPTKVAERLNRKYLNIYRWSRGDNFNEKNQRLVIQEFGLADDYFKDVDAVEAREKQRLELWKQFCASDLARDGNPEVLRMLGGWRFTESVRLNHMSYPLLFLVLSGFITPQAAQAVAAENEEIARTADSKRTRAADDD
jgi:hypothetical protein